MSLYSGKASRCNIINIDMTGASCIAASNVVALSAYKKRQLTTACMHQEIPPRAKAQYVASLYNMAARYDITIPGLSTRLRSLADTA